MGKLVRVLVVGVIAALVVAGHQAGAQTSPLPSAPTGDAGVKNCVAALNTAPTDATGALKGQVPSSCETAIPRTPNLAASSNVLAADVIDQPFNPFNFGGNCGSYVPPSVTYVPTNPVPNGPFTATGINWPPNSSIFGYSIAHASNGLPLGIYGLGFFNTNAAGQFVISGTVDSRPVAYYEIHFVSLQCPGVQVTLQVTAGNGGTTTTTTTSGTATTAGVTTTSTATTSAPTASSTPSSAPPSTVLVGSSIDANAPGTAVLGETASRGTAATPPVATAGVAFTGGSQNLLAWLAVVLGVSGWCLLRLSRRRSVERPIDK